MTIEIIYVVVVIVTVVIIATLNFGAVAGVKDIANPISLARMVMDCTDHVMLIGEGANTFAAQMGIPTVDPNDLISPVAKMRWEEWSKYDSVVKDSFNSKADDKSAKYVDTPDHETVGAVAMDLQGNIAAATSTGGITLKKLGRVGDSPLIGSGACCDNGIGGVSTTGHGESIAKVVLAYRALQQLQLATSRHKTSPAPGYSLESAFKDSLGFMMERVNGCAGMIGIDRNGMIAKWHTTPRMSWASVDSRGKRECGLSVNG